MLLEGPWLASGLDFEYACSMWFPILNIYQTVTILSVKSLNTGLSLLSLYSGMGCFWAAERLFWRLSGVFSTQVGFAGGLTPNPNYQEVCSGATLCMMGTAATLWFILNNCAAVKGVGKNLLCKIPPMFEAEQSQNQCF